MARGYTPYTGIHELYGRNPEHSYFDNRLDMSRTPTTEGGNGQTDNFLSDIFGGLGLNSPSLHAPQIQNSRPQEGDAGNPGSTGGGMSTPADNPDMGFGEGVAEVGSHLGSALGMFGSLASPNPNPIGIADNVLGWGLSMATNQDSLQSLSNMGLEALGNAMGLGAPSVGGMGGLGDPGMGQGMMGSTDPGMTSGFGGEGMGPAAGGPGASGGTGSASGSSGSAGTGGGATGQGGAPSGGP